MDIGVIALVILIGVSAVGIFLTRNRTSRKNAVANAVVSTPVTVAPDERPATNRVKIQFAKETLVGKVVGQSGQRVRVVTKVNGHEHVVRRKVHEVKVV